MKKIIRRFYKILSLWCWDKNPVKATEYHYKGSMEKKPNLNKPKNLNEKIMWLKHNTYWENSLVEKCADKYDSREYVMECGYSHILNEVFAVYKTSQEIDWSSLPKKFVIKTTNASKTNIFCTDKEKLDIPKTEKLLDSWLKIKYGRKSAEFHYKNDDPRIMFEKFLGKENGELPADYKFYCFNGEPLYAGVISERETGAMTMSIVDLDFVEMPFLTDKYGRAKNLNKPETFGEMIEISKKLSSNFPFVRIDLYDIDGEIIFGEMTFVPGAGVMKYFTEEALLKLGALVEID